jgi:NTE family protein
LSFFSGVFTRANPWFQSAAFCLLTSSVFPSVLCGDSLPSRHAVLPLQRDCRIGLALSGGAALGLAHIGVIKVLEEEKIPFCYVSGSSMGSIVGGMYACGYTTAEIESILPTTPWDQLLNDRVPYSAMNLEEQENQARYLLNLPHRNFVPQLPSGLLGAENVYLYLKGLTEQASLRAGGNFDSLVIPYRAIAVDFASGQLVVFKNGSVADAMRASMAIPGIFAPFYLNGSLLLDGGVVQFLPVEPLLEFKPDFIIAVDLRQPRDPNHAPSLLDLAWESFDLATECDHQEQLALADVVIRPDLRGLNPQDFGRSQEFIRRGEAAARKALPEIRRKLAGRHLVSRRHQIPDRAPPVIRRITLKGLKVTSASVVRREIRTRPGQRLDVARLLEDIRRINETGLFSQVSYTLEDGRPGTGDGPGPRSPVSGLLSDTADLTIQMQEKSYGLYSLGLRYDQTNQFLFGAEVAQENLFGSGAGAGVGFVLGNPNGVWARYSGARFFGLPFNYRLEGYTTGANHPLYSTGDVLTGQSYLEQQTGAYAKLGVNIGRYAYLKASLEARRTEFSPGGFVDSLFGHHEEQVVAPGVEFKFKNYSDLMFPSHGFSLDLTGSRGIKEIGSHYDYTRAELNMVRALPLGQRMVLDLNLDGGLLWHGVFKPQDTDSVPVTEWFRSGGPELAAAGFEEFDSTQKVVVGANLKYLITHVLNSQDYALYLNLAGDAATFHPVTSTAIRNLYYGGYIGLTQNTPAGPFQLGVGYGVDRKVKIYFSAGFDRLRQIPE